MIPTCDSKEVMPARKYPRFPLRTRETPTAKAQRIWNARRKVLACWMFLSVRVCLCVLATISSQTKGTLPLDTDALSVVIDNKKSSNSKSGCDFSPPIFTVWRSGSAPSTKANTFQMPNRPNVKVDNATVMFVSFHKSLPVRFKVHSVAIPNDTAQFRQQLCQSQKIYYSSSFYHGGQMKTRRWVLNYQRMLYTPLLH